jgi:peptidyl-prolyl cis-trans isomerase A (cyclophilin A)
MYNLPIEGVSMRRSSLRTTFAILISIALVALAPAQSSSGTQAAPAAKPSTAAKPAAATKPVVHHPATAGTSAVIQTSVGNLNCTLFPDKAPLGVANFIGLANGTRDWKNPVSGAKKHGVPLYDGTIFHRVIPGFMIQGGDPAGNGSGDPGYQFKNEVSSELLFDKPGRLAYANSGPDTNGSQFFITEVATPHLNGNYTVFGQCDEAAVTLVKQIARMARDPSNDKPFRPVRITHIAITTGHGATPGAAKPATAPGKKPAPAAAPKTDSTAKPGSGS